MDLSIVEPALATWVATLTGLPTSLAVWENAPRPSIPPNPGMVATLAWVSSPSVGRDGVEWNFDASASSPLVENVPTVRSTRVMVLQVYVESYVQTPGKTARAVLEAMRTRLLTPSSRATLAAINFAPGNPTDGVRKMDRRVDTRWISAALLEIRFNTTDSYVDTAAAESSITSVSATPTITRPDGATVPTSTWTAP